MIHLVRYGIVLLLCLCAILPKIHAQEDVSYKQFCSEIDLTRAFSDKWAGELIVGSVFSSTPTQSKVLETNAQKYLQVWGHYFFSPRWKFSGTVSYYYNQDVPDIGQYLSREWRFALQEIYYFHKVRYTTSTRGRLEMRYMQDEQGVYDMKYRYRQQFRYQRPLNSPVFRKGVFYILAYDELFFKPNAKSTGVTFFDRNYFCLGGGYLFTDDVQVELSYGNEYLPRDEANQVYHSITVSLMFNNLLSNLHKALKDSFPKPVDEE